MKAKRFILGLITILSNFSAFAQAKWEYLPNVGLPPTTRVEDVYFTNYNTGFAVGLGGKILKTKDGGETWKIVADSNKSLGGRSIEFLDDGKTGIAGGFKGSVGLSNDSGETWKNIAAWIPDTGTGPLAGNAICGMSHFGDNFYAVGAWHMQKSHFYRSKDRGINWTCQYIDTSLANALVEVVFLSEDTGFLSGQRKGWGVVLKTTDGGTSWRKVYEGGVGKTLNYIWKLQFIGKEFGVGSIQSGDTIAMIKTTDGGETWKVLGTGFKPFKFGPTYSIGTQSIGFVTPLKGWMGGYFSNIAETNDGGITWDSVNFGRNFNRIFVIDSLHAYAGGSSVYRYGSKVSVGIKSYQEEDKVPHNLYPISPNPSNGNVKIEFDLGTTTNVVLQVFQISTGQLWDIHRERMKPGHYTFHWQNSSAASGEYLVQLGTDEIPIRQKFILIK